MEGESVPLSTVADADRGRYETWSPNSEDRDGGSTPGKSEYNINVDNNNVSF